MNLFKSKILFFHGLNSSKESTKFHALQTQSKYCMNVDYNNLSYKTVSHLYQEMIETIKPQILVGHSLGGYWALRMSNLHKIPCVIANPSLWPQFRADYPKISDEELEHDIPQMAYLELGDEILDMHGTKAFLENYMYLHCIEQGNHRLKHPENLNLLIANLEKTL